MRISEANTSRWMDARYTNANSRAAWWPYTSWLSMNMACRGGGGGAGGVGCGGKPQSGKEGCGGRAGQGVRRTLGVDQRSKVEY